MLTASPLASQPLRNMPDVIAAVTAVATATGQVATQITERDKEKNTPAAIAAATAAKQQGEVDQINKNVSDANLDEIRKDDAE